MTQRILLIPTIAEGKRGCQADIEEFGIAVCAPTRDLALHGLRVMLQKHCETLLARGESGLATKEQLDLAREVAEQGFELQTGLVRIRTEFLKDDGGKTIGILLFPDNDPWAAVFCEKFPRAFALGNATIAADGEMIVFAGVVANVPVRFEMVPPSREIFDELYMSLFSSGKNLAVSRTEYEGDPGSDHPAGFCVAAT